MKKLLLLLGLLVILGCSQAFAAAILDFGTGNVGQGGTIIIGGGNASGSGIPIGTLTVTGTAFDGIYDVSGAYISNTAVGGNAGILAFDTALNTITITGGIPSLSVAQQVLLNGSFSSYSLTNTGFTGSIQATGPDTKAADLLIALGIPVDTKFQLFGFSIGFKNDGSGSPYTAVSTDITNTAVPEPGSLVLIGSGLIGLYGFARKRAKK